jgi:hypothetical protein
MIPARIALFVDAPQRKKKKCLIAVVPGLFTVTIGFAPGQSI